MTTINENACDSRSTLFENENICSGTKDVFDAEYIPYIIKWGRRTNLFAAILSLFPLLALTFVLDIVPVFSQVLSGFVSIATIVAIFWVIEPMIYYSVLGLPGTYMGFLAGNIMNLRLPCSAAAQTATGVAQGSNEATIISTIAIAVSIIVNIVFLTFGAIGGAALLQQMPDVVKEGLLYLLPALFGAVIAQYAYKYPIIGVIAFAIGLPMTWLLQNGYLAIFPGMPSYVVIIVTVLGTIFFSRVLFEKGLIKAK